MTDDKNKNVSREFDEFDLKIDALTENIGINNYYSLAIVKNDANINSDNREINEEIEGKQPEDEKGGAVVIPKSKVLILKKLLENIKANTDSAIQLLASHIGDKDISHISLSHIASEMPMMGGEAYASDDKIIEGVFDGEKMIGPDGKQYSVPVNYASKSKLIEGDMMKLTITKNGTFLYKQIGPIERVRVSGVLEKDGAGNFYVSSNGKKWRVLTASATYFRGELGDETIILIPKTGESKWAAVENIVKKG
jgi:hypothetical protein